MLAHRVEQTCQDRLTLNSQHDADLVRSIAVGGNARIVATVTVTVHLRDGQRRESFVRLNGNVTRLRVQCIAILQPPECDWRSILLEGAEHSNCLPIDYVRVEGQGSELRMIGIGGCLRRSNKEP